MTELINFLRSLLDPESYGWSVSDEVRQVARELLKRYGGDE